MGIALLCAAQEPIAPHSAFEPPAAKAAASLAASTKDSPPELLTTGEKTDWNETAPYAEAVEISHRLERASRFVKVLDIGTTPEGRTMIALVVSKDRAFTPEAAAKTGKAVIMIQSGIHAGRNRRQRHGADAGARHDRQQAIRRVAGSRDLRHHPGIQRGRARVLQPVSPAQPERAESHRSCALPRSG